MPASVALPIVPVGTVAIVHGDVEAVVVAERERREVGGSRHGAEKEAQ